MTDLIRETKIGQGMDFLPRKTDVLIDTLQELLQELAESFTRANGDENDRGLFDKIKEKLG